MNQLTIDFVPPRDPKAAGEAPRLSRQALAILALLRTGPQTNVDLARVTHRFGGRLFDLKALGFEFSKERGKGGLVTYQLTREPQG